MKATLPLIGSSSPDETPAWLRVERINWYPESAPDGRSPQILRTAAGLVTVAQGFGGAHRGARTMGGKLYAIAGESLWQVSADWTKTKVGTILGGERCVCTDTFEPEASRTLVIGTSERGYLYETGAGGFDEIDDAIFVATSTKKTPITLGGYTLWDTQDGAMWSDLYDPTTYPALNAKTAEQVTDGVEGLAKVNGDAWILGSRSIEIWRLTGEANENAFQWVQTVDYGVAGPYCNCEGDNGFFFLDLKGRVYRTTGMSPTRISTHQLEQYLSGVELNDAWMFSYVDRGHEFIGLTVPGGETHCFDVATGIWSRRKSKDMDRWRVNTHAFYRGENIFGDYDGGKLRRLDASFVGEGDGTPFETGEDEMSRELYTPYVHQDGDRVRNIAIELVAQFGQAAQTGMTIETAPVIEMRYSDDLGHNWTPFQAKSIGAIGEYVQRLRWSRLGSTRQRIFHFRITDPVRCDLMTATIEGEV